MKKLVSLVGILGVLVFVGWNLGFCGTITVTKRHDIELLKKLTCYVNYDRTVIDFNGLRKNFFPLLKLGQNDYILQGKFGENDEGKFFMIDVRKVLLSTSAEIVVGFFEITFYFEKWEHNYNYNKDAYFPFFVIKNGKVKVYGCIPDSIIDIYDCGKGTFIPFLQSDSIGIGNVLEKYLSCIPLSQREEFMHDSLDRYETFQEMDPANKIKFKF